MAITKNDSYQSLGNHGNLLIQLCHPPIQHTKVFLLSLQQLSEQEGETIVCLFQPIGESLCAVQVTVAELLDHTRRLGCVFDWPWQSDGS
jgi:hypothetical protein